MLTGASGGLPESLYLAVAAGLCLRFKILKRAYRCKYVHDNIFFDTGGLKNRRFEACSPKFLAASITFIGL